jgi:hypothetical protein
MAKNCFVLMPFAKSFDGIWENVIRPAVLDHGDKCTRADDLFAPGSVMDDVVALIKRADYLIADLTGRNANVYYELGFAHALDKSVILITQHLADVPFDLRHRRILEYSDTVTGGAALRASLKQYLANIAP